MLKQKLRTDAIKIYVIENIVNKYLECIEEIINIPTLLKYFQELEQNGMASNILSEILLQSKVEFNYEEE